MQCSSAIFYPKSTRHLFTIIDELKQKDADVSLKLVLKGRVRFLKIVNDPMFSAHREIEIYDSNNAVKRKYYLSDTPATLIGCTEQVNS